MPIKKTFTEIMNQSNFKTLGEVHDMVNMTAVQPYASPRSGKNSIKITFKKDGIEFNSFMGLSEKAVKITTKLLISLLIKSVGTQKAEEIVNAAADDEDVNDDTALAEVLAEKLNKKLKATPIEVYVDRIKDGDFWSVKWRLDKPVAAPADIKTIPADDFFATVNV